MSPSPTAAWTRRRWKGCSPITTSTTFSTSAAFITSKAATCKGMALMKLFFHPGTDMAQAMAETIGYVNRARAFMPPGTISPFVTRFDTGSVPVGYLVLSSETRTLAEIQDLALFRVRPMFASLPGVSAPPPFGGNARTVVVRLDPDRLRACHIAPEEVVTALTRENTISPSGNLHIDDSYPIVPLNSMVKQIDELRSIPINLGRESDGLHPRRGNGRRFIGHSLGLCPVQRPPSNLHAGDQTGRRFDAGRRERGQSSTAANAKGVARRYQSIVRVRSVPRGHRQHQRTWPRKPDWERS